jgi:CubicO group peptidase (beta-lactamase class C family)
MHASADQIDDFVLQQMAKRGILGVSLAVIDGGKIVKAKGYGVTDAKSGAPVTAETLFQAGSISKTVAAVGALRLVEQGKLKLDEDVNAGLKTWRIPENEFTKDQKVTLRRILSHSAGLTVHGFPGYEVGAPRPTLTQVLNGEKPSNTSAIRVDVVPGTQWRYSGGGYTILQQLTMDVSGQPFPKLMRESVLAPLGMADSTFDQPLPESRATKTASGYWPESKPVKGRWHVYPEMAAAGLWTTPTDLARFSIAVQDAYAGKPGAILSQSTAREMLKYQKADDGLGFFLQSSGKTLRFVHNGRDAGFDAMLSAYAESGQGAVIMINANEDSQMMTRILEANAKQYHWPSFPVQPTYTAIEDKEPKVAERIKSVFEHLSNGEVDRNQMTSQLASLVDLQMKSGLAKFLKDVGKLNGMQLVERENEGAMRVYRYRMDFKRQSWLLVCVIDGDNKIANLALQPE